MSAPNSAALQPPLSAPQLAHLAAVTRDWSASQLVWASGYLAGLAASATAAVPILTTTTSAGTATEVVLSIFYGSQTGNSRRLAEAAAARAAASGLPHRLHNLADYPPRQLRQEQLALFVISTQGDGDPPEDAAAFHEFLARASAPRLEKLRFGVLALGDSSYPRFCQTGRWLDERLAALGAARVLPRVDCDLDFTAAAEDWLNRALTEAAQLLNQGGAQSSTVTLSRVTSAPELAAAPRLTADDEGVEIELLVQQRLTGRHSSKDTRHLEFAVDSTRLPYAPGDGLAVRPRNPETSVNAMLTALGARADLEIKSEDGGSEMLGTLLATKFEITLVTRPLLVAVHARTGDPRLAAVLAAGAEDALETFLGAHQVADVLQEAHGAFSVDEALALLRPLARRVYSIASSQLASPDEVHLLVGVVAEDHGRGVRVGAASHWLSDLTPGATLRAHLEVNPNFHLPADDVPLIMVGPGTGVAPFRAYHAERVARGATGRNWLFFGERTRREDFLYQTEWQRAVGQGTLHRLDVAFSRDGGQREYVQHRMHAHAREIFAWLEEGAAIHVCGDARRMAKDVHNTLRDLIQLGLGKDEDAAADYLQTLQRDGRYRRDVY
jgi:sulfite reductase (NADPH) flavoprotein alpha-component